LTATARETITRALRRLTVIAEGETPSPEMANDALEVLNTMLFGFSGDGIKYAHAELGLDSTMNFPDEELGFVRDMLGAELAIEYGKELPQTFALRAGNARRAMQARYLNLRTARTGRILGPWTYATYYGLELGAPMDAITTENDAAIVIEP